MTLLTAVVAPLALIAARSEPRTSMELAFVGPPVLPDALAEEYGRAGAPESPRLERSVTEERIAWLIE